MAKIKDVIRKFEFQLGIIKSDFNEIQDKTKQDLTKYKAEIISHRDTFNNQASSWSTFSDEEQNMQQSFLQKTESLLGDIEKQLSTFEAKQNQKIEMCTENYRPFANFGGFAASNKGDSEKDYAEAPELGVFPCIGPCIQS